MEMRTRILGKMLNSEVQDYLKRNDIIIVAVGTTELHGGFPLDSETVISEAYCLKMAEACDGLVLTGLPYFYAGATASGRGTVQVSIRQGIDYLGAIARNLLRPLLPALLMGAMRATEQGSAKNVEAYAPETEEGEVLGTVTAITNLSSDVYTIEKAGKSILFPAVKGVIVKYDLDNGKLIVNKAIFDEIAVD